MKSLVGLLQVGLIVAVVIAFVRIAFGDRGLKRSVEVWSTIHRRPEMQILIALWSAVFLFDLLQTYLDDNLHRSVLQFDFTPQVYRLEESAVATLQRVLSWPPLTNLLAFFYMIVFPAVLFASATIYERIRDTARVRMVGYVYVVNYLICLPFYFFLPVREPWHYSPARVIPMIDLHSWPPLIDIVRPMSGIDNCFPSYHTSLSISLMLLAFDGGPKRFARAVWVSVALIILSTVYLGFHWLTDLLGGITAGWIAYYASKRLLVATSPHQLTVREAS